MAYSPIELGTSVGPVTVTGIYGFDDGNEQLIESMINSFAGLVGFQKVPQDGHIDTTDADRMVRIQRFVFTNFVCAGAKRRAAIDKLESDLDHSGVLARQETGSTVTPEQMWVSRNQDGVINKMPVIHQRIASGVLKRCSSELLSTKNLVLGVFVVGGIWFVAKGK